MWTTDDAMAYAVVAGVSSQIQRPVKLMGLDANQRD
jgi:hypothetical protein